MGIYTQIYWCEVEPCEFCGREIARGSKVYTDKQGNEFCSIDCLLSDAWKRHERGGLIRQRYNEFKSREVCHGTH